MDLDGEIGRLRVERDAAQRKTDRQSEDLNEIIAAAQAEMRDAINANLPRIVQTQPHIELKWVHRPFDRGIRVPVATRGGEVWLFPGTKTGVRRDGSLVHVSLGLQEHRQGSRTTLARINRRLDRLREKYAGFVWAVSPWEFRPASISEAQSLSDDYGRWAWRDGHLVFGQSRDIARIETLIARFLA